jgi:hypothetical protein
LVRSPSFDVKITAFPPGNGNGIAHNQMGIKRVVFSSFPKVTEEVVEEIDNSIPDSRV